MRRTLVVIFLTLVVLISVVATAVSTSDDAGSLKTVTTNTLRGQVLYRERILLPPDAEVSVTLENAARMDVAAETIASQRFAAKGGPPYAFSLEYDPRKLDGKGRYVLRARIEVGGHLMFTNDQQIPAFGGEEGKPVQVLVKQVGQGRQPQATHPATLTKTHWQLVEINGAPLPPEVVNKDLHLVFVQAEQRVHGFSGCNRFRGGYEENEGKLRFSQMASTRRACVEGMQREQQFLDAMDGVRRYVIAGASLSLFGANGRLILRFTGHGAE